MQIGSTISRKKNVPPAGSRRNKRREHRGYWSRRRPRQRPAYFINLRKNRRDSSCDSRLRANNLLFNIYRFHLCSRNMKRYENIKFMLLEHQHTYEKFLIYIQVCIVLETYNMTAVSTCKQNLLERFFCCGQFSW